MTCKPEHRSSPSILSTHVSSRLEASSGCLFYHAAVVSFLLLTHATDAQVIQIDLGCQDGWTLIGHGCYRLYTNLMPWESADRVCRSYGGYLATPMEYQDNEDLGQFVNEQNVTKFWIGFYGANRRNVSNADMTTLLYNDGEETRMWVGRWDVREPQFETGDCALIESSGRMEWGGQPVAGIQRWSLASCENKMASLCQRPVCSSGLFHCANGRCLSPLLKCDNFDDCGDRSDELDCSNSCTQHLSVQAQTVYNFPQDASNPVTGNVDCVLVLEAAVGQNIQLTITNSTLIESYEELVIRGGSLTEDSSSLVARFTGQLENDEEEIFYSSNNMMILQIRSTEPDSIGELRLVFEPVDMEQEPVVYLVATDTLQYIQEPLYGDYELGSQDYSYAIQAESRSKTVTIEIIDLDMAPGSQVVFRDGEGVDAELLASLEGSYMGNGLVQSSGRDLYFTKHTTQGGQYKGIWIGYKQGCDAAINVSAGYISPPGYTTDSYPRNIECTWTVNQAEGLPVTVVFHAFDIASDDMLQIFDENNTLLDSYTGNISTLPSPLSIPSGKFFVNFRVGSSEENKADFNISFSPDCPEPDLDLSTSEIISGTQSTAYGSTFTVACQNGSQFSQQEHMGQEEVLMECEAYRRWNVASSPKCTRVLCPEAPLINNGFVESSDGGLVYEGYLNYACFYGFTLEGPRTVSCQANGTWSEVPLCLAANCTQLPADPENGNKTVEEGDGTSETSYGTIVRYFCDAGYQLIGNTTLLCGSDGQWIGGVPTCQILTCYTEGVENGQVDATTVNYGQSVNVTCDSGYISSEENVTSMTCGADRELRPYINCTDYNECTDNNPCNGTCSNLIGSYQCSCESGYNLVGDDCIDIDECASNPCDGSCENLPGSFQCACPDGFVLYTANGTEGFFLAVGEDGSGDQDVYRLNASCVAKECSSPSVPEHGYQLTVLASYHYNDTIELRCRLGYMFDDSNAALITCGQDGNWTGANVACQLITCDVEPLVPSNYSNPGQLYPDVASIGFGESVEIMCNVPGLTPSPEFNRTRRCTFLDGQYKLDGQSEDYECGVIDCGSPPEDAGVQYTDVTGTSYLHTATFDCIANYTLSGASNVTANATVTCLASGQWDLGDLQCSGKACTDPGQIQFGEQAVSDYRNQVVFECTKPGYELEPPYALSCELYPNGTVGYNASLPSCVDKRPPTLQGVCENGSYLLELEKYSSIGENFPTISATDEGGIKQLLVDPIWPSRDEYITSVGSPQIFTYTYSDYAANEAECTVTVVAKDEVPPRITCPGTVERIFRTPGEVIDVQFDRSNFTVSDDFSAEENIMVQINPQTYQFVAEADQLLTSFPPIRSQLVQVEATDEAGNTASCSFDLFFKPDTCSQYQIREPNNATLSCTEPSPGINCTITCDDGFRLYNDLAKTSAVFSCDGAGQFFNNETDVKCVLMDLEELEGTFHLVFSATYLTNGTASGSCAGIYERSINNTLQELTDENGTTFITERCAGLPHQVYGYLMNLTLDNTANEVHVFYEILFKRIPTEDYSYSTCADFIKTYLEDLAQFPAPLLEFKPLECPSLQLQGGGLDFELEEYFCEDDANRETTPYSYEDEFGERQVGVCLKCPEGTFNGNDGSCYPCFQGTYSLHQDADTCSDCPADTSTYSNGAFSNGECIAECPMGTVDPVSGLGPCVSCPIGSYWNNSRTCLPCPANTTTKSAGSNSSDACAAICPPGYFNEIDGHAPCQPCPRHMYTNTSGTQRCDECGADLFTAATGSTSKDNCTSLDYTDCQASCMNGNCTPYNHHVSCNCTEGWTGENCSIAFDPCDSSPCHNGGNCTSEGREYNCTCPMGTNGTLCEEITPTCTEDSCNNGGGCENLVGGFECHCQPGFTGDSCDDAQDICQADSCQNGGVCVPYGNVRFSCDCAAGYTGVTCDELQDACNSRPCWNNGECDTVGPGNYTCDCSDTDLYAGDVCEVRLERCKDGAEVDCGDGAQCEEDYLSDNYVCVCPANKTYDDPDGPVNQTCEARDFCDPNPCDNGGNCTNQDTGFVCSCPLGYEGSRCQYDIDYCSNSPCPNGAECIDELLGYSCNCSGIVIDGASISVLVICDTTIDPCVANDCNLTNTEVCLPNGCQCEDGFSGETCDVDVDDCASAPCLHGGQCSDDVAGYNCDCMPGWEGENCQNAVTVCSSDICKNEAECVDLFNNYFCKCEPNTFGVNCSESVVICEVANPCVNGQCSNVSGNISCNCPQEYVGDRCETTLDLCAAGFCKNGATCVSSLDDYSCLCAEGYEGSDCSVNPDDCDSLGCPSTATCIDLPGDAICRCPVGKEGPLCEDDTNSDFDLLFRHSEKSATATIDYPIPVRSSKLSVALWVQFAEIDDDGVLLGVYTVPNANSLRDKSLLLQLNDTGLLYRDPMSGAEIFESVPPISGLTDGDWHYLVINIDWAEGKLNFIANTISSGDVDIPTGELDSNLWVILGSDYDTEEEKPILESGFAGKISKVTFYNRTLDFASEVTQQGNTDVDAVFDGAIIRWGLEYTITEGVQRLAPSVADNSCPFTYTGYPTCSDLLPGKLLVTIDQCPRDIQFYSSNRLAEVSYTEPTFAGEDSVRYSLSTEDVYTWGRYPVVIEASNAENNTALCLFNIYVQNDECTEPPMPAKVEDLLCLPTDGEDYENYRQCATTCEDGYASSIPGPEIHTCGPSGNWDPENKFVPYRLSPCGTVTQPKRNLVVTIRYTDLFDCEEVRPSFDDYILETLKTLNSEWNSTCLTNDCSDIVISDPSCIGGNRRRKRQTSAAETLEVVFSQQDVPETVTSLDDPTVTLSTETLYNDLLYSETDNVFDYSVNVVNAFPDINNDFTTVVINYLCDAPRVLLEEQCVACGPGTYYNSTTLSCQFCLPGTYQDIEGQENCTVCSDDSTTEYYGSDDSSDCKEKCSPGQFFNVTASECQNCSRGFYQPEEGQFYCQACTADKTTKYEGTILESDCANDCPPGEEIGPDNDCVLCDIGYYRSANDPLCIRCDSGSVTMNNGSTSEDDCNVADNGPGTYRNESDPMQIVECPVDEYQPLKWQYECLPCEDGYKTEGTRSKNQTDCIFTCGAGLQKVEGSDECEQCPKGYYRDGSKTFDPCDRCDGTYTTAGNGSTHADNCTIYICSAGEQPNATQNGCEPCPQGQYQAQAEQEQCDICDDGSSTRGEGATSADSCESYCDSGEEKIGNGSCVACPLGSYKNNAENLFGMCMSCGDKYVTESTGATHSDNCTVLNCLEGFQANATTEECDPCPKGTYQDEKYQTSCIPCSGNTSTLQTNSTSQDQCIAYCEPGFEKDDDDCSICEKGFYKNNDYDVFMECTECPNTNFTTEGQGSTHPENCSLPNCLAGSYIDQATSSCIQCAVGTWQNMSWTYSCNQCPPDKDTEQLGAVSEDQCLLNCPPGAQNIQGTDTCTSCPEAYYKDEAGSSLCEPCGDFSQNGIMISTEPGANSSAGCDKFVCLAGYYPANNVCVECSYGSYQPDRWMDSCLPCPDGNTTYVMGAVSQTACEIECALGEGVQDGQCVPCAVGYYNDKSDPTRRECMQCQNSLITAREGAESAAECNITDCSTLGQYRDPATNQCENCAVGQYQNTTRQDFCYNCPSGMTTQYVARTSRDDCKLDCPAGQQLNETSDRCESCPVGTYRSSATGEYSWVCAQCPDDLTTDGTGASLMEECDVPTCTAGYGYNTTVDMCMVCPLNTYQNNSNQYMPCDSCPSNQITASTQSTSMSDCYSPCSGTTTCSITEEDCVNDPSSSQGYRCDCKESYTRQNDGSCLHNCDIPDYCGEHGICQRSPFSCTCVDDYTGELCTIRPPAESLSDKEVETLVTAVVSTVCGLLLLVLIAVCVFVMFKRRRPENGKAFSSSEYMDRTSIASHSLKGYEDFPTFAVNPVMTSKPPSALMLSAGAMNSQGLTYFNNPTFVSDDDPAIYTPRS